MIPQTQNQKNFRTVGNEFTIDFGKELGKGQYGKVYHAFQKEQFQGGKRYACKMIDLPLKKQQSQDNEREQAKHNYLNMQFQKEAEAMSKIKSDYVIHLVKGFRTSETRYYLLTDLCNGGDLERMINLKRRICESDAKIIMGQIIQGMKDINDAGYMHRDLKPANILLHFPNHNLLEMSKRDRETFVQNFSIKDTPFQVKISDLGFAKAIERQGRCNTICGTEVYMPPEQVLLQTSTYTEKIDIWSLGVIFYQLLFGRFPFFNGRSLLNFHQNLKKGEYEFSEFIDVSAEAVHIISQCLQKDEEKRASLSDLYQSPYFKDCFTSPFGINSQELLLSNNSTEDNLYQFNHNQQPVEELKTQQTNQIKKERKGAVLSSNKQYTLSEINDLMYYNEQYTQLIQSRYLDQFQRTSTILRKSQVFRRNTHIFEEEEKVLENQNLQTTRDDESDFVILQPVGQKSEAKKKRRFFFWSRAKTSQIVNKKAPVASDSLQIPNNFTSSHNPISEIEEEEEEEENELINYPNVVVEKVEDYEILVQDDHILESYFSQQSPEIDEWNFEKRSKSNVIINSLIKQQ